MTIPGHRSDLVYRNGTSAVLRLHRLDWVICRHLHSSWAWPDEDPRHRSYNQTVALRATIHRENGRTDPRSLLRF